MSYQDEIRSDDPDAIRADIERTRRELGQDVDALSDKVNPGKIAQRQTDKVRHAATRMKDRLFGSASDVTDSTQSAVGHAGEAIADAPKRVASATQGNPVALGLIAFGAGLLAASLIPASKAEQQAVGRKMAKDRGVEHTVRKTDGTIGEKNSYGNDPRKSKG